MKKMQSLTNMTESQFNKEYNENKDDVFNYLNWKIGDVHHAEDLTIDVFMKAERTYNKEKASICSFSSWLRTTANSAIIDYYRTNHSDKYHAVSDFVNNETGEETFQFNAYRDSEADFALTNSELKERIGKAFSSLKPKYQRIAKLFFLDEEPYEEIAKVCNVPMGTVKGMISRCREMLQAELKGAYIVRTRNSQAVQEA
jgi:RNA polymerase sigma factor (sigma-70 family)